MFSVSRIRTGGSGSAELACQANRRTVFRKQTHRRDARSGAGRAALIIFGATAYLERTETVCFHPAYMFRYTEVPDNFSDPTAVPLGHRLHFQVGPLKNGTRFCPKSGRGQDKGRFIRSISSRKTPIPVRRTRPEPKRSLFLHRQSYISTDRLQSRSPLLLRYPRPWIPHPDHPSVLRFERRLGSRSGKRDGGKGRNPESI